VIEISGGCAFRIFAFETLARLSAARSVKPVSELSLLFIPSFLFKKASIFPQKRDARKVHTHLHLHTRERESHKSAPNKTWILLLLPLLLFPRANSSSPGRARNTTASFFTTRRRLPSPTSVRFTRKEERTAARTAISAGTIITRRRLLVLRLVLHLLLPFPPTVSAALRRTRRR